MALIQNQHRPVNVQAVVLDFKIPVDDGSNSGYRQWRRKATTLPSIVNAQDYYPFRMIMPARKF
ncbi:MAG: hypothetical protein IPJ79_13995 [Bacteroidetes bacterium]|nr:hypothetical protein [Bacteroidota bacterium]